MKIKKYEIGLINIKLNKPFITALRRVDSVESIILTVETDDGIVGYGSATETKVITGDTKESIIDSIKIILNKLEGVELINESDTFFKVINRAVIGNTSGKAAVDMSIYDLLSKNAKMPLYEFLGGKKKSIKTDLTISMQDPDIMLKDSLEAYDKGFRILKIKLGDNINEDFKRLDKIYKGLGNTVSYRIDANQGWNAEDSIKIIKEMERKGMNIELVEQPVHYKDIFGLKYVTDNVNTPILADESVFSYEEAVKIIEMKAADKINIKLMKTGGIYNAIKIAKLAKEKNIDCMIGSMMESPISINAALNFALAYDKINMYDMDVPSMYDIKDFKTKYKYGPIISFSNEFGLGIEKINLKNYEKIYSENL